MAVIGTFGSFTAARLGIYASQSSLNVTGNNISNINTKGYTRQRMDLVSLHSAGSARYANSYNLDIGYGVIADSVSQLRDPFLDIRFRDEQTKVGTYETRQDGLKQLAHILDEVGDGDGDFGIIEAQFNDFLDQLQYLNRDSGSEVSDTIVRASAEKLVDLFNDYSEALVSAKETMTDDLRDKVDEVNTILTQIRELNVSIREAGIFHHNALELRDQRNVLIDDLSKYMKIEVRYSMEKLDEFSSVEKLSISVADSGNPPIELINGIYGAQITMPETTAMRNPNYDPTNPTACQFISRESDLANNKILYTNNEREAYRDKDNNPVKNDDDGEDYLQTINPAITLTSKYDLTQNTSGQYLKADGTGTDDPAAAEQVHNAMKEADDNRLWMQVEPLQDEKGRYLRDSYGQEMKEVSLLGDTAITGSLQSLRELLTEEGEYASDIDIAFDKDANTKRGIPYYQQALDALAKRFADEFNKANQMDPNKATEIYKTDGGFFVDKAGQPVTREDGTRIGVTDVALGNDPTDEVIKKAYSDMEVLRQKGVLTDAYRYYNGGVLFSNNGNGNDANDINAGNITISKGWATGDVRLLNTKQPWNEEDHSTLQDNIGHMITMMGTKWGFTADDVSPDAANGDQVYFNGTFQEMLAQINLTLGTDQKITNMLYDNVAVTALARDNDRQSVSGVDLNDEATSMMVFQKSYSAACQLMTTLDSMLDKLINGTIR